MRSSKVTATVALAVGFLLLSVAEGGSHNMTVSSSSDSQTKEEPLTIDGIVNGLKMELESMYLTKIDWNQPKEAIVQQLRKLKEELTRMVIPEINWNEDDKEKLQKSADGLAMKLEKEVESFTFGKMPSISEASKSAMDPIFKTLDEDLYRLFSVQDSDKAKLYELVNNRMAVVKKQLEGFLLMKKEKLSKNEITELIEKEVQKVMETLGSLVEVRKSPKLEETAEKEIENATKSVESIFCGKKLDCEKKMDHIRRTERRTLKSLLGWRAAFVRRRERRANRLRNLVRNYLRRIIRNEERESREIQRYSGLTMRVLRRRLDRMMKFKARRECLLRREFTQMMWYLKRMLKRYERFRRTKARILIQIFLKDKLGKMEKDMESLFDLTQKNTQKRLQSENLQRDAIEKTVKTWMERLIDQRDQKKAAEMRQEMLKELREELQRLDDINADKNKQLQVEVNKIIKMMRQDLSFDAVSGRERIVKAHLHGMFNRMTWKLERLVRIKRSTADKLLSRINSLEGIIKRKTTQIIRVAYRPHGSIRNTVNSLTASLRRMVNHGSSYQAALQRRIASMLRTLKYRLYNYEKTSVRSSDRNVERMQKEELKKNIDNILDRLKSHDMKSVFDMGGINFQQLIKSVDDLINKLRPEFKSLVHLEVVDREKLLKSNHVLEVKLQKDLERLVGLEHVDVNKDDMFITNMVKMLEDELKSLCVHEAGSEDKQLQRRLRILQRDLRRLVNRRRSHMNVLNRRIRLIVRRVKNRLTRLANLRYRDGRNLKVQIDRILRSLRNDLRSLVRRRLTLMRRLQSYVAGRGKAITRYLRRYERLFLRNTNKFSQRRQQRMNWILDQLRVQLSRAVNYQDRLIKNLQKQVNYKLQRLDKALKRLVRRKHSNEKRMKRRIHSQLRTLERDVKRLVNLKHRYDKELHKSIDQLLRMLKNPVDRFFSSTKHCQPVDPRQVTTSIDGMIQKLNEGLMRVYFPGIEWTVTKVVETINTPNHQLHYRVGQIFGKLEQELRSLNIPGVDWTKVDTKLVDQRLQAIFMELRIGLTRMFTGEMMSGHPEPGKIIHSINYLFGEVARKLNSLYTTVIHPNQIASEELQQAVLQMLENMKVELLGVYFPGIEWTVTKVVETINTPNHQLHYRVGQIFGKLEQELRSLNIPGVDWTKVDTKLVDQRLQSIFMKLRMGLTRMFTGEMMSGHPEPGKIIHSINYLFEEVARKLNSLYTTVIHPNQTASEELQQAVLQMLENMKVELLGAYFPGIEWTVTKVVETINTPNHQLHYRVGQIFGKLEQELRSLNIPGVDWTKVDTKLVDQRLQAIFMKLRMGLTRMFTGEMMSGHPEPGKIIHSINYLFGEVARKLNSLYTTVIHPNQMVSEELQQAVLQMLENMKVELLGVYFPGIEWTVTKVVETINTPNHQLHYRVGQIFGKLEQELRSLNIPGVDWTKVDTKLVEQRLQAIFMELRMGLTRMFTGEMMSGHPEPGKIIHSINYLFEEVARKLNSLYTTVIHPNQTASEELQQSVLQMLENMKMELLGAYFPGIEWTVTKVAETINTPNHQLHYRVGQIFGKLEQELRSLNIPGIDWTKVDTKLVDQRLQSIFMKLRMGLTRMFTGEMMSGHPEPGKIIHSINYLFGEVARKLNSLYTTVIHPNQTASEELQQAVLQMLENMKVELLGAYFPGIEWTVTKVVETINTPNHQLHYRVGQIFGKLEQELRSLNIPGIDWKKVDTKLVEQRLQAIFMELRMGLTRMFTGEMMSGHPEPGKIIHSINYLFEEVARKLNSLYTTVIHPNQTASEELQQAVLQMLENMKVELLGVYFPGIKWTVTNKAQNSVSHNMGINGEVIVIKETQLEVSPLDFLKELKRANIAHSNGKQVDRKKLRETMEKLLKRLGSGVNVTEINWEQGSTEQLLKDVNQGLMNLELDLTRWIFSPLIGNPIEENQPTVIKIYQQGGNNGNYPVIEESDNYVQVQSSMKAGAEDIDISVQNI